MNKTLNSLRAAFFTMMIWVGILVPRIPDLKDHFNLTIPELSRIFMIVGVSGIFLSKLVSITVEKYGSKKSIYFGLPLGFFASLCVALQISIPVFCLGMVCFSFSGFLVNTSINTQANNYRTENDRDVMSQLTAFANIGALSGLAIGALLLKVVTTTQYILGMQTLVTISFLAITRNLFVKDSADPNASEKLPWFSKKVIPLYLIIAALFAQGLAEWSVTDWGAILGRDEFAMKAPFYLVINIFFQLGIITSRFLVERATRNFGLKNFVFWNGIFAAAIWATSIQLSKNNAGQTALVLIFVIIGFFAGGFGVGPYWPSFLSAATKVPFQLPAVFARVFSIISFSFVFGPGLIGQLSKNFGLTHAMFFAVASMLIPSCLGLKLLPGRIKSQLN